MEKPPHPLLSKIGTGFMRLFFRLLYHPFAWSYDLVAATVSLGRWKGWVKTATGLLTGPRVLELGFGPGHMQTYLVESGFIPYGVDESRQMAQQARHRLANSAQSSHLARAKAQRLPFADASFDCVVATFPTPYITDPDTLNEVKRVLRARDRERDRNRAKAQLVVLMSAWITGQSLPERLMRWLFQVTGETPQEEINIARLIEPYTQAGFEASIRFMELPGSRLMFILARKPH